jgi:TfoX/Sxy family transcriptional regulator of competence genes
MAVTPSFRLFVLDQLGRVAPAVRSRGMFGGVGIYSEDLFFALIASDTLYFKVDETNRDDFLDAGMGPFMPYGEPGEIMQYYEVPAEVLEQPDELRGWAARAIDAAARARRQKDDRRRSNKRKKP